MTDITVVCPSCSALLKLADAALLGKKIRCPKCKGVVEVPMIAGARVVTPAAPPPKPKAPTTPDAIAPEVVQRAPASPRKPTAPPVPRRSVLPLVLVALLFVFLLFGSGLAVAGYFAWTWYNQPQVRPIIPVVSSPTTTPNEDPKKPNQPNDGDNRPGFPTPDAVLDAYVKALRNDDVAACKATMTAERLAHDETFVRGRIKPPVTPEALDKEFLTVMKFYATAEWQEGQYKRFPVEMDADSQEAAIVCVYQNNAKGQKDRYRRYVFRKSKDGWLQTDWTDDDAKKLDAAKYAYSWGKPADPGFPLDAETKKALAGVKLKRLDVKVRGVAFTMLAPEGAKAAEDVLQGGFVVEHGERFKIKIDFGKPNIKVAREAWKRLADDNDRFAAIVVEGDTYGLYKTVRKVVEQATAHHFIASVTLGHVDVYFHDAFFLPGYTQPECLLMLHCARSAALKPDYKPVKSRADLEKLGFQFEKDQMTGKIVGVNPGENPVTDATLALLAKYAPDQQYLYLAPGISDDGLKSVALLTHLKELYVPVRRADGFMDGSGLAYLKGLKELEYLELENSDLTDDALVHLKDLTNLRSLNLTATQVTGQGFVNLKGLTKLETLYLSSAPVTDDGLKHLAGLTNLVNVTLYGTKITDDGLQHLKGLKKLAALHLGGTNINGRGFVHLAGLTQVAAINLANTQTTDEHLKHFAAMKNLGSLQLDGTPITGSGLAALHDAPLYNVTLSSAKVTDEGMKGVGQLKKVSELTLDQTAITDAGLTHLKDMTELRMLSVNQTKINGSGFKDLAALGNLDSIYADMTQLSDDGLKHLAALKALKFLYANNTPVGDAGLAQLKDKSELVGLSLEGTKITDKGLVHLKDMKKLNALYAANTGVTEKGIADLKKALPELKETSVGK